MWDKIDAAVDVWDRAPRLPLCFLGFGLLWFWGCLGINMIANETASISMLSATPLYQDVYVLFQIVGLVTSALLARRGPLMYSPRIMVGSTGAAMLASILVVVGGQVVLPSALLFAASALLGMTYGLLFALWVELCGRFPGVKMLIPYLTATMSYFALSIVSHYVDVIVNHGAFLASPLLMLWCLLLARRATPDTSEPGRDAALLPWQIMLAIVVFSAVFDITGGFVQYSTTSVLVRVGRIALILALFSLAKFRTSFDFTLLYNIVVAVMIAGLFASLVAVKGSLLEQIVVQAGAESFSLLIYVICCSYAYRMRVSAASVYGLATAVNLGVRFVVEKSSPLVATWLPLSMVSMVLCAACILVLVLLLNKSFLVAQVQPLPPRRKSRAQLAEEYAGSIGLSPQEQLVLVELLEGHTTAQAADNLFISQSTVRVHQSSIYKKAGVHSRDELLGVVLGL